MPIKDPDERRRYQREWKARRRTEWTAGKHCVDCGATESLEIDHRDPSTKVDHNVWSWAPQRREAELEKCEVRCTPCHVDRSRRLGHLAHPKYGEDHAQAKVTAAQVTAMRAARQEGERISVLAARYNIGRTQVRRIIAREKWATVP